MGTSRAITSDAKLFRESKLFHSILYGLTSLAIVGTIWQVRTYISPDGISYLDLAREMLKGDPGAYFHAYWSPLFPALLALGMKVGSPFPIPLLLLAHAVVAAAALAGAAAFVFFTSEWRCLLLSVAEAGSRGTGTAGTLFGLSLYLFATFKLIGAQVLTPDMLVMVIVLAVAGTSCRLASGRGKAGSAIWLGVLLAVGYFAKAAMLPLGLLLVVLLAASRFGARMRVHLIMLTVFVFAAFVLPYITTLSKRHDTLTFGESGRLNYAWSVLKSVPMYAGWTRGSDASGTPVHSPRVLGRNPTVLEFAHTTPGTMPLWYDPSYFYEGLKIRPDLSSQIRQLKMAPGQFFASIRHSVLIFVAVFAALIAVVLLSKRTEDRAGRLALASAWLIFWAIGAFSLYSLVVLRPRYVAPFFVLLVYAGAEELFARLRFPASRFGEIVLIAGALLLFADLVASQTTRRIPMPVGSRGDIQQAVAKNLKKWG